MCLSGAGRFARGEFATGPGRSSGVTHGQNDLVPASANGDAASASVTNATMVRRMRLMAWLLPWGWRVPQTRGVAWAPAGFVRASPASRPSDTDGTSCGVPADALSHGCGGRRHRVSTRGRPRTTMRLRAPSSRRPSRRRVDSGLFCPAPWRWTQVRGRGRHSRGRRRCASTWTRALDPFVSRPHRTRVLPQPTRHRTRAPTPCTSPRQHDERGRRPNRTCGHRRVPSHLSPFTKDAKGRLRRACP